MHIGREGDSQAAAQAAIEALGELYGPSAAGSPAMADAKQVRAGAFRRAACTFVDVDV